MDSLLLDKHNLQDPLCNHNNNNHKNLLQWTLKVVVSITLVCLFLCFSSGFPLVPHSLCVYYNTWLFSFLTQTLERKYMFLICNGILAFLAKSFSFSLPRSDNIDQPQLPSLPVMNNNETNEEVPEESMVVVMDVEEETQFNQQEVEEEKEVIEIQEEGEEVEENDQGIEEEKENEESLMNETLEEEEDDEEVIADSNRIPRAPGYLWEDEEESREVDSYYGYEEMGMSNEELNMRFEEFIRKMKEEIRIEAQRPLIITA